MPEVRVIARSIARKGRENQVRELLRGMIVSTRAESDANCMTSMSQTRRGGYFYEIWESQTALDRHAASPHFKHLEQTIGELIQEPFEVNTLAKIQAGAAAR
jgi:quinol monooxygenase YgiN